MHTVILDGNRTVSFLDKGVGPPLYLVHGFGGNHNDWESNLSALAGKFRVIVPNFSNLLLNYAADQRPLKFSDHVKLIRDFVLKLTPDSHERFIVGASYGGAVCWGVLIESPDLFKGAVLVGPLPPNPIPKIHNHALKTFVNLAKHPRLLDLYLLSPLGKIRLPLIESIFHAPWIRPGKRRKLALLTARKTKIISQVIRCFAWIVHNEDWPYWESRLNRIKQPVHILYGVEDNVFKDGTNINLHHAIASSQLKVVENSGHLVMREQPEAVTSYILEHLRGGS